MIADLAIPIQPVFDRHKREENHWFSRTANQLHVPTREGVIRRALLVRAGTVLRKGTSRTLN